MAIFGVQGLLGGSFVCYSKKCSNRYMVPQCRWDCSSYVDTDHYCKLVICVAVNEIHPMSLILHRNIYWFAGFSFYISTVICLPAVSVEACRRNIKFNGSVACSKVESHLVDARVHMLTHPKEYDVVHMIIFYFFSKHLLRLFIWIWLTSAINNPNLK